MTDERTPLTSGPPTRLDTEGSSSYIHQIKSHETLREKQVKTFQCWICCAILGAFAIGMIISIGYIIFGDIEQSTTPNRTNASATANFPELFNLISFPLDDELVPMWDSSNITDQDLADALSQGEQALGDKELLEEALKAPPLNSPTYRHQKAVSTTQAARLASKIGFVENRATNAIARKYNMKKLHQRWSIGKGPTVKIPHSNGTQECNFNAKYRTNNGTCNSKKHPYTYGVALMPFRRQLTPDYGDGVSSPRAALDGKELPSARQVSLEIHRPSYHNDPNFTVMLAVWGQFLDHDITSTALNQGVGGKAIECCDPGQPRHPECYPVPLGPGDPYFYEYNLTCMNFVRSIPAPTGHLGPREQLNQATAFIDGSVVYGSDDDKVKRLRTDRDGKLAMFVTPDNRELLPLSTDPKDGCNEEAMNAAGKYCFESGDARANENLHLTSMHLIWARHHNNLTGELKKENPDWDDEMLFQSARRILAAQMQHITYNEFLPIVIGDGNSESMGIKPNPESDKDTYNSSVDPSIANVFAASAFRFAHTLLPGLMRKTRDPTSSRSGIELHKMLFNPYSLYSKTGLDDAIGGAMSTLIGKYDPYFTTELTEHLFEKSDDLLHDRPCGLDLVSLNIQRGRDHGLPSYPHWRKHCRLPPVDTWAQLAEAVDPASLEQMRKIYQQPENVDVYTGALSEPPVKGGIVGPLITCLLGDQFVRLKQGDSFWYERTRGTQRFTKEQLQQIYNTRLSSIICRNSDAITNSPVYLMRKVDGDDNPVLPCEELDTFSFGVFRDKKGNSTSGRVKLATGKAAISVITPKPEKTDAEMITETEAPSETTPLTTVNFPA
ncbi:myeloperoxidase [Toxorhynchites rutilus septentrionalis]|uniref:myeloperoxidase n=1 Tax=Toxorhynchites rutilus septentrionalis TaxID=329112 RepID=UPI00247AB9E2|nr:myeloperoxidase [Toxorhynchites rutilus septentrionalis]XP_055636740.1 myeloperoxidase [Toxorhynchites rutilus septentrionalis]XP_055636750.1 myeloperoxidase [Toxorhynchites rutilus septentrionalis]